MAKKMKIKHIHDITIDHIKVLLEVSGFYNDNQGINYSNIEIGRGRDQYTNEDCVMIYIDKETYIDLAHEDDYDTCYGEDDFFDSSDIEEDDFFDFNDEDREIVRLFQTEYEDSEKFVFNLSVEKYIQWALWCGLIEKVNFDDIRVF